jgi:Holliday junction resolvase-like predicted endonuclease
MNTGVKAEGYVKNWCEENGRKFIKKHGKECEGCDLIMQDKNERIFIEVKGSTKEKFNDVRPYITMNELDKAIKEGKNYEFHILLGLRDGIPKKHDIFSGLDLIEYKEFIVEAIEFQEKWSKNKMSKILWPEVYVYLKKNIGKDAASYMNSKR